MIKEYTINHLRFIKALFAFYLFVHFVYLIPFASELFSADGMFPAELSLTYGYFPNVINWIDNSVGVTLLIIGLTILSLLALVGVEKKWLFLLLWFGWACLLCRNPFIRNPGYPYVGWMMLAFAVIFPVADPQKFRMPKLIFYGAWTLMAMGYTMSGIDKLASPSWQNGEAIGLLLQNPLSRDYFFADFIRQLKFLHSPLTYLSLFIEVVFLPLALWRKSRPWIWSTIISMHLGILFLVDFADLTFGVLMIHFLTFDPRWIKAKKLNSTPLLFFDGVCGLCDRAVDFVMLEDHGRIFKFATLQGQTAKDELKGQYVNLKELSSLYVLYEERLMQKSEAVLFIAKTLGGIWALSQVFYLVPRPFRDSVYDFVARNRYKVFGKKESCRLPTAEERSRFID